MAANMADDKGRVLLISFTPLLSSLEAIKRIHGTSELSNARMTTQHLEAYPWMIKNKYFTVEVHLCHGGSSDVNQLLLETSHLQFQGIVLIFDQEEKGSLQKTTESMKILEAQNASVQLLLNAGKDDTTSTNPEQGLSKTEVLEWCLKYSFELVELNPNDDEQEEAGEFGEQTGFPRVIQAMNCGEWPNMELRETKKGPEKNTLQKTFNEMSTTDQVKKSAQNSAIHENDQESKTDEEKATEKLMEGAGLTDDESELLRRLGQDEPDGESFDELFTKLRDMKDHAATLPDSERKSYAEQVALAFWKAMGGDDDEVLGLDDD